MADWSLLGGGADCKALVTTPSASDGIALSAPGSANTKGSWQEVSASLPYDIDALIVSFAVAALDNLFDIGVGAAGSEVVVAGNLYAGNGTAVRVYQPYVLPIRIAAGARLAIRFQGSTSALASAGVLGLRGNGLSSGSAGRVTTYGANTADSGGTEIDPGLTINTKGAWVQITASTSGVAKAFALAFGGCADSSRSTCRWLVDVAIGAAGSEQILIGDFSVACRVEHDTVLPQVTPVFPIAIPAGSRIAVRAQCDITTAGDRLFDCFLYALE